MSRGLAKVAAFFVPLDRSNMWAVAVRVFLVLLDSSRVHTGLRHANFVNLGRTSLRRGILFVLIACLELILREVALLSAPCVLPGPTSAGPTRLRAPLVRLVPYSRIPVEGYVYRVN